MPEAYTSARAISNIVRVLQGTQRALDIMALAGERDIELGAFDPRSGEMYGSVSCGELADLKRFIALHRGRRFTLCCATERNLIQMIRATPGVPHHIARNAGRPGPKGSTGASASARCFLMRVLGAQVFVRGGIVLCSTDDSVQGELARDCWLILITRGES